MSQKCSPEEITSSGPTAALEKLPWPFRAGDDGIAMHGQYYAVADSDPRKQTVVIASSSGFPFDRNDSLTLYAPDTQCWGTGVIDALYSVNQPSATNGKQNNALSAKNRGYPYNYDDCDFMQVRALG